MTHDPIYGLDIETDNSVAPNSGLNPNVGGVTSAAVSLPSEDVVFDRRNSSELKLLTELEELLAELPPGLLSSWNGAAFDFPFLSRRFEILGIKTKLRIEYDASILVKYQALPGFEGAYRVRWGSHTHTDVQFAYKAFAEEKGIPWSLKPVGIALGYDPVEVDRENVHLLTPAEERAYVASDASLTRKLTLRAFYEKMSDLTIDKI